MREKEKMMVALMNQDRISSCVQLSKANPSACNKKATDSQTDNTKANNQQEPTNKQTNKLSLLLL